MSALWIVSRGDLAILTTDSHSYKQVRGRAEVVKALVRALEKCEKEVHGCGVERNSEKMNQA
jgi:hypothetical protein